MTPNLSYQKMEPAADLKDLVSYYWQMCSTAREEQMHPDLLIPDGFAEIIFLYAGSYERKSITKVGLGATVVVHQSCVVGLHTATQLVRRCGIVNIVGVKLKPYALQQLLKRPSFHFSDKHVAFTDLNNAWLNRLQERLGNDQSLSVKAECLDQVFRKWKTEFQLSDPWNIVKSCIQTIVLKKGLLEINQLCLEHHKSIRQVQRYFKEYIGVSPKQFCQIIRFKAYYKENIIDEISPKDYFNFGYFDQNHFIKDFRKYLGITPSKMRKSAFQRQNEIAKVSSQKGGFLTT